MTTTPVLFKNSKDTPRHQLCALFRKECPLNTPEQLAYLRDLIAGSVARKYPKKNKWEQAMVADAMFHRLSSKLTMDIDNFVVGMELLGKKVSVVFE